MTRNQIEYWNLQEAKRSNLAKELETNRSNMARETENQRSNLVQESFTRELQPFQKIDLASRAFNNTSQAMKTNVDQMISLPNRIRAEMKEFMDPKPEDLTALWDLASSILPLLGIL